MDPKWWYRGAIVVVVVAFILLIARAAFIGMRPNTAKIDRIESEAPRGSAPSTPAAKR